MRRCTVSKRGAKRTRTIPVHSQLTMRGSCDYFDESDIGALADRLRTPAVVEATRVAERLNYLSEDFLLRYAHHNLPSPSSKTAEWCRSLERDVDALMQTLGVPDLDYPEREMNPDARIVLTNIGVGLALPDWQYQWMRLGDDAWQLLDRVPAALWGLKRIAA